MRNAGFLTTLLICFILLELKDANLPHIMISYQWDCQSIMVKVKDKLRQAGYKVWMDVEHMSKYILEMIWGERKIMVFWGFRPSLTQTGLYSLRSRLEA